MAVPIAAVTPFLIVATVLNKTGDLSDEAYGGVALLLMTLAAIVGTLIADEI